MLLENKEPLVVGGKSTAKIEAENGISAGQKGLKNWEKKYGQIEAKKQLQLFPPKSDDLKTSAAPLTFRGKPIVWGVSQEMKNHRHPLRLWRRYGGTAARPQNKLYPVRWKAIYKGRAFIKPCFRTTKAPLPGGFSPGRYFPPGSSQRAKLQYHILAQRFPWWLSVGRTHRS